jgi:hypothetical protein
MVMVVSLLVMEGSAHGRQSCSCEWTQLRRATLLSEGLPGRATARARGRVANEFVIVKIYHFVGKFGRDRLEKS